MFLYGPTHSQSEIEILNERLNDYASHDRKIDELRLAFRMDRWSKAEKSKAISDEALSLLSARWSLSPQQGREDWDRVQLDVFNWQMCSDPLAFVSPTPPPAPPTTRDFLVRCDKPRGSVSGRWFERRSQCDLGRRCAHGPARRRAEA